MRRLLLDTHAFIWWDSDPAQLSAAALAAVRDPANEVWLIVASVWEMVIKAQLGKLTLRLPLADIVRQQQANGLRILPVALAHVLGVEGCRRSTRIRSTACSSPRRMSRGPSWFPRIRWSVSTPCASCGDRGLNQSCSRRRPRSGFLGVHCLVARPPLLSWIVSDQ